MLVLASHPSTWEVEAVAWEAQGHLQSEVEANLSYRRLVSPNKQIQINIDENQGTLPSDQSVFLSWLPYLIYWKGSFCLRRLVKWSNNLGYSGFISQRDLATLTNQYQELPEDGSTGPSGAPALG